MGTGEIALVSKIGGREKLDLLAGTRPPHSYVTIIPILTLGLHLCTEDYTATAAGVIATPFRLEQCVKIAESQLNGASPVSHGLGPFVQS